MEEIRNWLRGCGLDDYFEKFKENGWERFQDLETIGDKDLEDCIPLAGRRQRFRNEMGKKRQLTPRTSVRSDVMPTMDQREISPDETDFGHDDKCSMSCEHQFDEGKPYGLENNIPSSPLTALGCSPDINESSREKICILGSQPDIVEENIRQLVPSTRLYTKNSENVRYYERCTIFVEGNRQQECFKAQMETMMESFEKKDRLYVETRAFQELVDIIEDRHMAVITGLPGDGKTTMAYHLSLKYYKEGYEHVELHFANEWKDYVDGTSGKDKGRKQFVIIDDIFGRMSVDERKLSEWTSLFDLIQNIVVNRKGDLIVVCTCRKYVYMDVRTKLSRFSLFQASYLVDMTSDRVRLNIVEKNALWDKYAKEYSVNMDNPKCIKAGLTNPHGFPHCVELFCTDFYLQQQGECFFDNPMQCVAEQIAYFMNNPEERLKYCVLLMVLLRGNRFQKSYLEDLSGFQCIFQAAGLTFCPTKIDLSKALESLTNTYITYLNNYYRISHDSVREHLAFMFIQNNTSQAIEELDFIYLTDHTRCFDQGKTLEETVYVLAPQENKLLAKRMIKEIRNGNVVVVCAHKAWESISFIDEFMKCALSNTDRNNPVLLTDPRNIFTTKDSSSVCIFYFDIFEALQFFNHTSAVKKILDNPSLKPLLQDASFTSGERTIEKPISHILCHTLDCIGYDNETRRALRQSNTTMEILDTLCLGLANRSFSCTILGSQAEGTHVTSQMSAVDTSVRYLLCCNDLRVINDITEISPRKPLELLMVSDEITEPGYVKLQIVNNGIPQKTNECKTDLAENTKNDYQNRVCIFKAHPDMLRVEKYIGLDTTTRMVTGDRSNILYESYRCLSWPDIARSWQNRARHYNWPSRYDLEQMKALGTLLVPVGCSDSIERHLEYKICFYLQERYLMDKLNQTQHKCYILLKMINNSVISALVKEPALISYHLKMCLFHVIENTSGDIWVPSNLLCCLRHCLNCVLKCTISGMCPNYFNPEENLFCGRIHGELQGKLRNLLETLLRSDYDFLLHIECGNVGHLLEAVIKSTPLKIGADHVCVSDSIDSYIERNRYVVLVKDRILSRCYDEDLETCVSQHLQMIQRLKGIDTLAEHTKNETQRAVGLALPWVELSFMNNLVASAVTKENTAVNIKDILFSHQWNINARETNAFSAKLKQAAYLHLLGFQTASMQILNELKRLLDPLKISICGCRFFLKTVVSDEVKAELKEKSEEEIRTKHCMPCLVFLPTELVPAAIWNTMDTPESESTLGSTPYRFGNKWAVVDSKVLLFYLLYLNHSKLQMATVADDDIEKLLEVLETDPNLGHKEIGWSILGWIYSQEGQHVQARNCFTNSSVQLEAYITAQIQHEK